MRPKQWTKNVFVLAGLFFDGKVFDLALLLKGLAAFTIFCLLSSALYLVNDLADMERDHLHPVKKHRPLASGMLPPAIAKIAVLGILAASLPSAFLLGTPFGVISVLYAALMILYTFLLKNVVIIDVMTVAAGFVLRVAAGAVAVEVSRFSAWLYVCTTLLALFIAINKRRHELALLTENAHNHRSSLQEYNLAFLDDMTSLVTAAALVSYSFYTFSAPNLPKDHSMMLTIPFVMYGIFRYLYLIHAKDLGGTPEEIVLGDWPLLVAVLLWALTAGGVIYSSILLGG